MVRCQPVIPHGLLQIAHQGEIRDIPCGFGCCPALRLVLTLEEAFGGESPRAKAAMAAATPGRSVAGVPPTWSLDYPPSRRRSSICSACRRRVCSSSATRCCAAPASCSSVSTSGPTRKPVASAISAIRRRVSSSQPSSVTRRAFQVSNRGRSATDKSAVFGTSARPRPAWAPLSVLRSPAR